MADTDNDNDTLRDDIARALSDFTPADPPADDPPPREEADADPPDDARARDDAGRFAKQAKRETLTLKPAPPKAVDLNAKPDASAAPDGSAPEGTPTAPDGKQPAVPPERVPPPVNWKGRDKISWEKLSPYLQTAIRADYERIEGEAAPLRAINEAIGSSRALLEREGGSLEGGVKKLLALSEWASANPVEFAQTFIRQRGLSAAQIFGQAGYDPNGGTGYQPTQQMPAPEIAALQQRLDAMEKARERASLTQALSTIESFANDPKHPFFTDVQDDMERMLKADPSLGLEGAYERATWARPETRAQLLAQQQSGGANNAQAVAAARKAKAASMSGSPVPGAKADPTGNQRDDLRSELEKNYRAAMDGQQRV